MLHLEDDPRKHSGEGSRGGKAAYEGCVINSFTLVGRAARVYTPIF